MSILPGQPAPDFSLYDSEKNKVTLSGLKGNNVVLLFFPFAFSSVCTKELCSVRDNISLYNQSEAIVFGISVDSLYALARFKEEQKLNFGLLSDFNKEVSAAYGCLAETWSYDMKGVSKRSAFVIDRGGVVQYAEILENPGLVPDFQAIEKTLHLFNKKLR
jgi:glutaredoxin-dependent peroxiredoxin